MSHQSATYYLSLLSAESGRPISPKIAEAAPKLFPEDPGYEDEKLHAAVEEIAAVLATGAGPISAGELRSVVSRFSERSGTPFCPPAIAALGG